MKRAPVALAAAILGMLACSGPPHIEQTAVSAVRPAEVVVYFSAPVSPLSGDASLFTLRNASTGDTLPIAGASVSGQVVTLTLESPYVLTAGHVYDLYYRDIAADGRDAAASGSDRFVAEFVPPDKFLINNPRTNTDALLAWHDSAGNVLLLWTPNNLLGCTQVQVWRRSRDADPVHVATLAPNRSAFWTRRTYEPDVEFALRAVNPYGVSGLEWVRLRAADVGVFSCAGTCLASLWPSLPGYARVTEATTCDRAEFRDSSSGVTLIREVFTGGVLEMLKDTAGIRVSDTLADACSAG